MDLELLSDAIDRRVLEFLLEAVASDPATHSYALYDLIYEPGRSELRVVLKGNRVVGYALRW